MQQLHQQVECSVQIQSAPDDQQLKALEAAIRSIRRTGCFGNGIGIVTFEWPKVDDLRKMVENMPTKIADFRHSKSTTNSKFFGAFQVALSNGMASPEMQGKKEFFTDFQSLQIKDYSQVKRVNGTKQDG
jgi:hypothetical protein